MAARPPVVTDADGGATAFGMTWLRMLAAVAGASVLGLAVTAPLIAASIDRREHRREAAVMRAGLEQVRQELLGRVGSDANWDPAERNLVDDFSERWAQETLTSAIGSDVTARLVTVTGYDDGLAFIRLKAAHVPTAVGSEAEQRLGGLVRRLRGLEAERKRGSSGLSKRGSSDWIVGSDVVLLRGRPMLVVASLVGGDTGTVAATRPRSAILAYWSDLGEDILPGLGSRLLLQDASVGRATADAGGDDLPLRSAAGDTVATVTWTADRPGRQLLLQVMPPLGLVVIVFGITVLFAYRHAISGSRALRESRAEAYRLAFHDGLTGLPNRRLFTDRLTQALTRTERQEPGVALLLLDLDRFKIVNDSLGHQSGDELLQEVARRILAVCQADCTCARLGGDEFVVLVPGAGASAAAALAKGLAATLARPVEIAGRLVSGNASIGISIGGDGTCDPVDLLRQADMALYKAKEQARGSFRFFELEMDRAMLDRAELGADLLQALTRGELEVVYQPQFEGDQLVGVEALTRWTHPDRGPIPPSVFVPLAEEYGLIDRLSDATMPTIFADSRRWPGLTVAINMSASQLHLPNLLDKLDRLTREHGVQTERIELEITEGVLMADVKCVQQTLAQLRARGFRLALDDFGTGYSSLGYLSAYSVDRIKIDRSFVVGLPSEGRAVSIVRAILAMAEALGIAVIAEGVETAEQQAELHALGCNAVQGYLTGRPTSPGSISLLQAPQQV